MTDKTKYKNQNGKQDTAIQCNTPMYYTTNNGTKCKDRTEGRL